MAAIFAERVFKINLYHGPNALRVWICWTGLTFANSCLNNCSVLVWPFPSCLVLEPSNYSTNRWSYLSPMHGKFIRILKKPIKIIFVRMFHKKVMHSLSRDHQYLPTLTAGFVSWLDFKRPDIPESRIVQEEEITKPGHNVTANPKLWILYHLLSSFCTLTCSAIWLDQISYNSWMF